MKYLFTASRLMKAKDIVKQCQMRHTEEGHFISHSGITDQNGNRKQKKAASSDTYCLNHFKP